MKKLAIIIGHTQHSPGACHESGLCEFGFNQPLAHQLADKLLGKVETTIVYRGRPNDYRGLPAKVNRTGADYAISLHCNSFNAQSNGTEMLYWHTSSEGKRLASSLQRHVLSALGLRDRGLKPITPQDKRGRHLLQKTNMPCVICEPGFFSNERDFAVLMANQSALVQAYADAVLEVLG